METAGDIRKKGFIRQGFGTRFDLGLTYYPKKNIQFTASILDVGFIKHSKDVETFIISIIINMRYKPQF
jgi:hypothetical protein